MADIDNKLVLGTFGAFCAVYGWILRHLFGKAQFKDVCAAKHRGVEDCLEAEEKRNTERYIALQKSIDELRRCIEKKL